ncbi:hypothetical protein [Corynebacterium aquilae]|uniref:Uncharacterized protein n=1 Tax=Corynebacterium aquilae DSM 44791 TaxID=1431546 RepID=A0A1L7CE31_9CORY|nr:hypothetical protein [Corynebacterium aquilae]APT84087.1 hypothetical protein CAQU_02255 [Corynebacterium aquilae DSM 44791]
MTFGYLVHPDLTSRAIDFEIDDASKYFGELKGERVAVAFQEDGSSFAALYSAAAAAAGAEPNPVASMGRNEAETGNSAFFSDPTRAICGVVIFVGHEGEDISKEDIAKIDDGIRAAKHYRQDFPQEYALWRNAVLNMHAAEGEL